MVLDNIRKAVTRFLGGGGTYERAVKEFVRELQRELLRADVNVKMVFELTRRIEKRAKEERPPPGFSRREWFLKIVYEELTRLFGGDREPQVLPPKVPWVILLVGVQGSGKTTTAGKLALYYIKRGYKVGLVSTDTYRPGAYEQLKTLAEKVGALFYGEKSGDPAEIAKTGVSVLLERGAEIIIVDTAGRHGYGEEKALLDEMRRIADAVNPDDVILVIDAAIGQKAYDLAKRFHEATPIGSIIVTKMDGTAKGGGALSAVAATGAIIKFIGTGEDVEEFEVFHPKRFVARLLGMGDLEGILERLKRLESVEELEKTVEEMLTGKLNFRILYRQLVQLRKMGPLRKVLQMVPGLSLTLTDDMARLGEEKIKKWLAIMNSMTYEELDNPEIIDKSRMRRIAIGAGVEIEDVKELINYYKNMQRMLRQLRKQKGALEKLLQRLGRLG